MKRVLQVFLVFCLSAWGTLSHAEQRIEDLTTIAGVRTNQVLGYGLVVGLDGSGDTDRFTTQSLKSMLNRLGISLPSKSDPKSKNVAAVMVTATLPPFAKPGQKMDITVSALGNAKSLRGGTLLFTPLKGLDDQIYAVAQGNIIVGGFSASGKSGSKITKNVPSVGRIPNGATIERAVSNPFASGDKVIFNINRPNFSTAKRVAQTINQFLGSEIAFANDPASVHVHAPLKPHLRVSFVASLQELRVAEGVGAAKVIINSRTGTIVIGQNVVIQPVAISHGDLVVSVTETNDVSQPEALSSGTTTVTGESNIVATEEDSKVFMLQPKPTLRDLVQALNSVGAPPQALITILEALKESGALRAELIVI